MRETSGAVTNSRKWMRRMNAGGGAASRMEESRRGADYSAAAQQVLAGTFRGIEVTEQGDVHTCMNTGSSA